MSDAKWALVATLMPAARRIGRPRVANLRDVFDAILYIATTGCQWRMLEQAVHERRRQRVRGACSSQ